MQTAPHSSSQKKPARLAVNLNPPFFTLLTFPFAYLSYSHALYLWILCSIFAGAISVLRIQKTLSPQNKPTLQSRLSILLAFFAYFPTFASLQLGQVTLLLLPLLVLSWQSARNHQSIQVAMWLGIAASLKPFIGLFALYFLLRKEYRALITFILTGGICALFAVFFLGAADYHAYLQGLHHITWAASSWNVSLYGVLLRLFGGPESNAALFSLPKILPLLYSILVLLLLGGIINFFHSCSDARLDDKRKVDLEFSMILVAMLLISPLGWLYYFPFLSLPFLQLFYYAKQGNYPIFLFFNLGLFFITHQHSVKFNSQFTHHPAQYVRHLLECLLKFHCFTQSNGMFISHAPFNGHSFSNETGHDTPPSVILDLFYCVFTVSHRYYPYRHRYVVIHQD
ncbi:glycosyltransferase family 87 protein [Rickettsiella massiliensis]|uniref:glycosyltransferase family 87 protein n=1 Tax=Rickettsiella massiliensis TaxID=676517 RepID=UPI00178C7265|nr:glycosyltransferase family 87 protein [Rickettsiella massiliensis]